MAKVTYQKSVPDVVAMSQSAAKSLLKEGDGDAALVYLYMLSTGKTLSVEEPDKELRMGLTRFQDAIGTLERLGLVKRQEEAVPLRPERPDELPEYTAEDVERELNNGTAFRELTDEVQMILGKMLSSEELKRFLGIYDSLGLPRDVIVLLVSYCTAESKRRYGPGRTPTMRQIERTAYIWEKEQLFTPELAERYMAGQQKLHTEEEKFAAALCIRGRALTATEKNYVDSWLNMGFGEDAAEIAYDKTVTATGKFDWKYANGIFSSWHRKGLHRGAEILTGDDRKDERKTGKAPENEARSHSESATEEDLERMKHLIDRIRQG